jgi:hypothetical protein
MFENLWAFVRDPENREVLTWIGGGLVVVVTGVWALYKSRSSGAVPNTPKPTVSAESGSVAIGGRADHAKIKVGSSNSKD